MSHRNRTTVRNGSRFALPIAVAALLASTMIVDRASAIAPALIKDIRPGSEPSFAEGFVTFNGAAYFRATDGVNGIELWRTDGTEAGTQMVTDLNTGAPNGFPTSLSVVNGSLYFAGFNTSPTTGQQFYTSDGTSAGTHLVADLAPGAPAGGFFGPPAPGGFTALNGSTVIFTAVTPALGQELYRTNGTTAGTSLVRDIHPGTIDSIPAAFTELNGVVYFAADDSVVVDPDTGVGTFDRELWRTDGTDAGTYRVKDINPGPGSSYSYGLTKYHNNIYFTALDETETQRLYKTDGTTAGTVPIASFFADKVTIANDKMFVTMDDGVSGQELYISDGTTTGTTRLKDINPGPDTSSPFYMTGFKGKTYFSADDGSHGSELWVTDGTEDGTQLFTDLNDGPTRSGVQDLTVVGDKLFFVSILPDDDNFTVKTQLWMTDGTEAGTELVFAEPGNSFGYAITNLTVLGNTLLFTAPTGVDADGFSTDSELFSIVVPEPASFAVLGLGALLVRCRRH
jgi:ELWxxDGT repeat protein